MSESVVVAIIRPQSENFDEVKAVLMDITADVHGEEGCELYALHEGVSGELVFVEKWSSREAWQKHMDGPTVQAIGQRAGHLFVSPPEVYELYAAPAGTFQQGQL